MSEPGAPAVDEATVKVLDVALKATDAYARQDLAQRISGVRQRVVDPRMRVLVVGEFKQGKSSVINALVNAPVCPVDDDVATAVPTAVHYAEAPIAIAVHSPDDPDAAPAREQIPVDRVAEYVSEGGNPSNARGLRTVEIGLPRQLLRPGLVLVDTPGVGGLGSAHSAMTVSVLPSADAVVLCSDASQELTGPELAFLDLARDVCPTVCCVLTKIDFYAQWRTIAELDRRHLAARDITAPILATSATLRSHAVARDDRALNDESGYPALVAFLRDHVIGDTVTVARRASAHAVTGVTSQLETRFVAERAALTDPGHSAELITELERAQQWAADLRGRAARWQQTLGDGITDLSADADHELRGRMRQVTRAVEDAVRECDPGKIWAQLEDWLSRMVAHEVAAHYAMVTRRAERLARDVVEHFAEQETMVTARFGVDAALATVDGITPPDAVEPDRAGVAARGLTAMRGSYGGMMMVGILGSVLGFGLFNPVSVGFGLVLGRKAIRDERERALTQRRAQAVKVCRSYVDEVSFRVGKDARDGLRRLQRQLRDTFTAEAEQVQRSTAEALTAAKDAVRSSEDERRRRLRDVDAELARIRKLAATGRGLIAGHASVAPGAARAVGAGGFGGAGAVGDPGAGASATP